MKKLLFVLASKNFRDTEYIVPRVFFEQNNYEVETISTEKISYGRFDYKVENDLIFSEINIEELIYDFSGLFFVGGGGSLDFLDNTDAKNLAKFFVNTHRPIGAICAAPRLFLNWGILQNKKFTGWNGDNQLEILAKKYEATFLDQEVVIDENIITSQGPATADCFSRSFLELLNK